MENLKRDSERERRYDRLNLGQRKILSPRCETMTSQLSGFWVREATTGNTSSFAGYHMRAAALPAELRRDLWILFP